MGDIKEPENAKVDDWHDQDGNRRQEAADQAMVEAGGDEGKAQQLFDEKTGGKEHAQGFNRPN